MLNYELYGEHNRFGTLLIAHGLLGSLKNWRTIAKYFSSKGRKVVIVDMRNHGFSFWSDNHSYEQLGEDLKLVIKNFDDHADVIGHSMGGKAAMTLALRSPQNIRKLIVVDISPVNYSHERLEYISVMQSINMKNVTV